MEKKADNQEILETEELKRAPETAASPVEEAEKATLEKGEKKKKDKKDKFREELETLQEAHKKLQEEFCSMQDQNLRLRAEYDNFRKRSITEKTALYNDAVSDTLNAILPVADNIARALAHNNAAAEDMQKGLEMISTQLAASMEALGVKEIGKPGEIFDPNLHNAVSHIEDDSLGENTIAQVLQKGYVLGERVVRHAMVQVAN